MRRSIYLLALITVLALFGNTYAQEADETSGSIELSKQAISVYLVDEFKAAYQFGNGSNFYSKILVDFSLSGSDGSTDESQNSYYPLDTLSSSYSNDNNNSGFSVSCSYFFMHDFINAKHVSVYGGVGPLVSYRYYSTSVTHSSQNESHLDYKTETTNSNFSIGVEALIGVEAHLTDKVFLFAESQLLGTKTWSDWERTQTTNSDNHVVKNVIKETDKNWSYRLRKILIGVGIYF